MRRTCDLKLTRAVSCGDLAEDLACAVDRALEGVRPGSRGFRRTGGQGSEILACRHVSDFGNWRLVRDVKISASDEG